MMESLMFEAMMKKAEEKVSRAEINQRISEGMKGHKHSEETKAKIANSMKGHKVSDESRAKMAAARKLYWENKRKSN